MEFTWLKNCTTAPWIRSRLWLSPCTELRRVSPLRLPARIQKRRSWSPEEAWRQLQTFITSGVPVSASAGWRGDRRVRWTGGGTAHTTQGDTGGARASGGRPGPWKRGRVWRPGPWAPVARQPTEAAGAAEPGQGLRPSRPSCLQGSRKGCGWGRSSLYLFQSSRGDLVFTQLVGLGSLAEPCAPP